MRRHLGITAALLVFSSGLTGSFFMPGIAEAAVSADHTQIAVTTAGGGIFLRPVFVSAPARTVTVRSGDSLARIARRVLGDEAWWPQLYWRNVRKLGHSTVIHPGEVLKVDASRWAHRPRVPLFARVVSAAKSVGSSSGTSNGSPPSVGSSGGGGGVGGAFGECVRMAENGGSYSWATGNGGGAYQFLASTWVAYGGSAAEFGSAGPAEQDRVFMNAIAAGGQGNWSSYDGCSAGLSTQATDAVRVSNFRAIVHHPRHRFRPLRLVAFRHALAHKGAWYVWGGTGPSGFDCSGLVYRSYIDAGRPIGRDTYDMLAEAARGLHLHFTSHPRKGMLAFFGSGHVELYVRPGVTFGAHHSGTRIGYKHYDRWWHPSEYVWVSRR